MRLNRIAMSSAAVLLAAGRATAQRAPTATPVEHLVVIFDENISFDHYFATYPVATNPPGEPRFVAARGTPAVNGLRGALLTRNPNLDPANGAGASNPFRLDRSQASTSDQSHGYRAEQQAYHGGRADRFPAFTGRAGSGGVGAFNTTGLVMGYYDGNTVTALWNYAQHFAMSDNSYGDQYGPSSPGAINLVSGQTNGVAAAAGQLRGTAVADGQGGATLIGDVDPAFDDCSTPARRVAMTGKNIGDLLDARGVTWGWFEGGFRLDSTNANGTTGCRRSTIAPEVHDVIRDYVPHHEPFQYYASTANPHHTRPVAIDAIGTARDSAANHQYDVGDFFAAARAGHLPAVAYLKPPGYQDGHAGNSDPIDEQQFIVTVINFLQQLPEWKHTAVIILYDDSDGWYDHQMAPIGNASYDSIADQLSGPGRCGTAGRTPRLGGVATTKPVNGRCGPGARQPFLVISPWARRNYVDHRMIIQSSVTRFIEDNWLGGERLGGGSFDAGAGRIDGMFDVRGKPRDDRLWLDPATGVPVAEPPR